MNINKTSQCQTTLEEFKHLNNVKAYTIVANCLSDSVESDIRLSLLDKAVWWHLYRHKNYETYETAYSPHNIARRLNKKLRTIQRSVNRLIACHYLIPIRYNNDANSTVADFRLDFPRDRFNELSEAPDRKERAIPYENPERKYIKDDAENILFTRYTTSSGLEVFLLSKDIDADFSERQLKQGLTVGLSEEMQPSVADTPAKVAAEQIGQRNANPAPEKTKIESVTELAPEKQAQKVDLETKIEDIDKKIDAPETHILDTFKLRGVKDNLKSKLVALVEPEGKIRQANINYVIKKQRKNTTDNSNVNPSNAKNNRYFSKKNEPGKRVPISYSNCAPVEIPKKYVTKIKRALNLHSANISDPPSLLKQMLWAIARRFVGKPKDRLNATHDDTMRYNTDVAIKLIREKRWLIPSGFIPREVLEAEKKAEYAKEVRLRSRTGQQGYVNPASEAASFKSMLEKSGRV